jgi:PIN domain nuclease of toxin-antitoxin system
MVLLDTCTLLWLGQASSPVPDKVVKALRSSPPTSRFVSAITAFEIGYKCSLGKLVLSKTPSVWFPEVCAKRGLTVLPITDSIALRASALPRHHRDPADRFIISTAQELSLTILTPDPLFEKYDVDTLWH